jgi:hypothetical protein
MMTCRKSEILQCVEDIQVAKWLCEPMRKVNGLVLLYLLTAATIPEGLMLFMLTNSNKTIEQSIFN